MAKRDLEPPKSERPTPDFRGAGIIVTRPKGQSENLLADISKHNGLPFDVPALEIVATRHHKQAKEKLDRAATFDYLLFTSPNSVKFAEELGLDFSAVQAFIAIGTGTENHLAPFIDGKEIITAPKPYTSEALIAECKKHNLTDKTILIISGEGGRRLLGNALKKQGAKTQYCNVYRRKAPDSFPLDEAKAHIDAGKPLYLMITSQEALNNIQPALENAELLKRFDGIIVGSERLAGFAKKAGFSAPIVAKSALEADMWNTLKKQFGSDSSNPKTARLETQDEEHSMSKKRDNREEKNLSPEIDAKNENQASVEPTLDSSDSTSPDVTDTTEAEALETPADLDTNKEADKETGSDADTDNTHAADDAADDVAGASNTPAQPVIEKTVVEKRGNGVAWLALLVALAGTAAGGYLYYDQLQKSPQSALASLNAERAEEAQTIANLKSEVYTLQKTLEEVKAAGNNGAGFDATELESKVAYLAKSYNDTNTSLDNSAKALQNQIDQLLENQIALTKKSEQINVAAKRADEAFELARAFDTRIAEQGLAQDVVLDEAKSLINTIKNATDLELLRLTEIDYLLKVAVHKVRFDKDFEMAKSALDSALQRLELVKTINFGETKSLIEANIKALSALEPVDLMAVTERLDKVSTVVQHAPLKEDSALLNLKKELFGQRENGGDNWKEKLKGSLKGLVVIENHRTDVPELMAKEDRFFLNQNIQLELTAAKVALMRDQFDVFTHSVETVKRWIETYFDEDNSDVREAIKHLQWLLDAKMELELPNVQRTLTDFEATLRAYRGEL